MRFILLLVCLSSLTYGISRSSFLPPTSGHPTAGPAEQWFTQTLDHFDPQERRTWQQRYFVNDTFWNPDLGGPIFLQIGGEGAISPAYVTELEMVAYGQKYGALLLAVEHRFYGKSEPLPDLTTESLRYLSSQQALADASQFIEAMKVKFNAQDSPVVTFGGSYPGNLAAWFRLKYPHQTIGSVASSAPVQAELDFFQYLDVVGGSLSVVTGKQCDEQIRSASAQIEQLLESPSGTTQVEQMFSVCAPLNGAKDVQNMMSSLMGNFMGTVQYDNEGSPITIETLCTIMNNGTNALAQYAAVNSLFLKAQQQTCLDASYADMIAQVKDTSQAQFGVGIRQWTYQTCTEFGYFQTTDSSTQPFGTLVPLSFFTGICVDAFGFDFLPGINATNNYYGGNHPKGATNILFVNGSLDPWHALSVTHDLSDSLTAIYIDGTAHCANMMPPKANDPASLVKARQLILQQIGEWLVQ